MRYTISLAFLTVTLCYSILVNVLFYGKKHIQTKETTIFGRIAITNLVGIILEIGCIISLNVWGPDSLISIIINKCFLIYFLVILMLFSLYVVNVAELQGDQSSDKKSNILEILRNVIQVLFVASTAGVILAKIHFFIENDVTYSYGPAVNIVYVMSAFCSLGCITYLVLNIKKLREKRNIPIIAFVCLMGLSAIIQQIYPQITLATSAETLIIFLMFHTIENPDLKLISELEVARDQANKANNAKTDFLSNMSHEIRTPLNAIVGFSDCIMEAKSLDEAQENAKDIVNAGQTLLEIVNGILDISKIEAGKLEIINSKYNAPETFKELAKLISTRMAEKGLDFTYYIAPDLPDTLFGDHANIKKIVTNLLSNACKYTDTGFVRYEVHCVNVKDVCRLIISVEDSGRGIKKESIDKMFTKFQRLDEDKNTTIEGTGLGLAITKQLTELMGGKIIVHTVYGEGSKFTAVINQKITTPDEKTSSAMKDTLDLTDVKILIVDDAPMNLKVAQKLLERYHANCIDTCDSGFECINRINIGREYDIIFLDDMMPKMSGVITLQTLKEDPNFKTPTIALTANAISGMREKYLADGFDDFLAKPIDKNELVHVVNRVLGRTNTERLIVVEEEETPNNEIIPVEGDIEQQLGAQLDLSKENPGIESTNQVENNNGIMQVVDINAPTQPAVPMPTITPQEQDAPVITPLPETPQEQSVPILTPLPETTPVQPVITSIEQPITSTYDENYLKANGADLEKALELLGDMEMYNSTIGDFVAEVDEKWNNIKKYRDANDMENYAILVHSLKSDCKYLGFYSLADIAYQHELKSKEKDSQFVMDHFSELENEYNRVIEVIKNYNSQLKG